MVKSLYSGVSGLKTHQQRMDVIGNNIANVNTVGNKADVVTFKDVYYQTKRSPSAATATLGGVNPRQVGYGVQMNTTAANMTQSGYTQSDNIYDMAINGNGFFQVMDGSGTIYYTRAGIFNIDESGYLVNADGYHVLGVNGNSTGQGPGSEIIRVVVPNTDAHCSSATKLINGTNVTISVSAPSNYTNISVGFVDSAYPYATFSNNILSIYFNRTKQYESQEDFERAIQLALQAGGVNLPDDVELKFEFENIPSDTSAKAASNSVEGFEFTTDTSTCVFERADRNTNSTREFHATMSFSVDDVPSTDTIIINHINADDPDNGGICNVKYEDGEWTIGISDKATFADISDKLKAYIKEHPEATNLSITGFNFPDGSDKHKYLDEWAANTGGKTLDATAPTVDADAVGPMVLRGAAKGEVTGAFDFVVQEKGAFANDYQITFAYVSGYDNTKAVWDGNNLTITVCANSTVADVNEAIKAAANGDEKKIIRFNNISGLDYGTTENTYIDGNKRVTTTTFVNGYTLTVTETLDDNGKVTGDPTHVWRDETGEPITGAALLPDDYTFYTEDAEGKSKPNTVKCPANLPITKITKDDATGVIDDSAVWNPGMRSAFFSGNPHVSPMDGADSFFTGVAKSLSTFALTDGRTGAAQDYHNFTDVTVQQDGRIIALHPVHGYMEIGRIDLANFVNPNGLSKVGGTNFMATVASGPAQLSIPGSDGAGVVLSGALEMSNVDLADEFTNMITTQRGYQANSRVITVSDTMIEELLSLKR